MSQSEADRHAADAIVDHHARLADALTAHAGLIRDSANGEDETQLWQRRDALLAWLHAELLPHAHAEEAALYPAAANQPGGRALIDGMIAEHQAITALVTELTAATTPVDAAAAARALSALFAVHLAKENDLVVPLVMAGEDVSLAGLLEGMHELIGASHPHTAGTA